MVLFGGVCGRCSVDEERSRDRVIAMPIIGAGRMHSSLGEGFSPCAKPSLRRVNPDVETIDWRAVCGKTARTVRRAGWVRAYPDPYPTLLERKAQ